MKSGRQLLAAILAQPKPVGIVPAGGLETKAVDCVAVLLEVAAIMSQYAPTADANCETCYVRVVQQLVDEWRSAEPYFADNV